MADLLAVPPVPRHWDRRVVWWLALAWLPWLPSVQCCQLRSRPFHLLGTSTKADLVDEFKWC